MWIERGEGIQPQQLMHYGVQTDVRLSDYCNLLSCRVCFTKPFIGEYTAQQIYITEHDVFYHMQ